MHLGLELSMISSKCILSDDTHKMGGAMSIAQNMHYVMQRIQCRILRPNQMSWPRTTLAVKLIDIRDNLTRLILVLHICVSELGQHYLR